MVADTLEDLPASRREAGVVTSAIAGWTTTTFVGRGAGGEAFREALSRADHLHFTGHAEFAGPDGWRSGLVLEEAATWSAGRPRRLLRPADVLAAPRVPRGVVLSACESAGAGGRAAVEDLGMARAFVLAGSDWAIGTSRPVRDQDALEFTRALYEDGVPETTVRAAAALASAQLLAASRPGSDWAAYRLIARGGR